MPGRRRAGRSLAAPTDHWLSDEPAQGVMYLVDNQKPDRLLAFFSGQYTRTSWRWLLASFWLGLALGLFLLVSGGVEAIRNGPNIVYFVVMAFGVAGTFSALSFLRYLLAHRPREGWRDETAT
jgi:hypothetical protein